jgi:transposase
LTTPREAAAGRIPPLSIGLDLGKDYSHFAIIDESATVIEAGRVRTTAEALAGRFGGDLPAARIVMECCGLSPWTSRLLTTLGHEVIVANARRLKLLTEHHRKSDEVDAETLARLGRASRADLELVRPITHRPEQHPGRPRGGARAPCPRRCAHGPDQPQPGRRQLLRGRPARL